MIFNVS
jgi:hypothetical protein